KPELDDKTLSRVCGPIGLDLGGDSPCEIALAIVSEIQSVLAHHSGRPLKSKTGKTHAEV
ncbi:MAG: XdhC family protein, partial [candidate division Zixibacteria bacterium]